MSNDSDISQSYRRLSVSPPFRRNKFVRASFKMLSSRWKPSSSSSIANRPSDKIDNTSAPTKELTKENDFISERFGKEFNQNVKKCESDATKQSTVVTMKMPPPSDTLTTTAKGKMNFFGAYTKENVYLKQQPQPKSRPHSQQQPHQNQLRHQHQLRQINFPVTEIPKNVAPKAAAILQIPLNQNDGNQFTGNTLESANDINVRIEPKTCELIANSKQFKLFNALSRSDDQNTNAVAIDNGSNGIDRAFSFKKMTTIGIRRTPYHINNQPYSKLHSHFHKQKKREKREIANRNQLTMNQRTKSVKNSDTRNTSYFIFRHFFPFFLEFRFLVLSILFCILFSIVWEDRILSYRFSVPTQPSLFLFIMLLCWFSEISTFSVILIWFSHCFFLFSPLIIHPNNGNCLDSISSNKIRKASVPKFKKTSEKSVSNRSTLVGSAACFQSPCQTYPKNSPFNRRQQQPIDRVESKMDFLVTQVSTAVRQEQELRKNAGVLLMNRINNHFNGNHQQQYQMQPSSMLLQQSQPQENQRQTETKKQGTMNIQPQTKMTKKKLKLAQTQLDKLTQINIHLNGM